MLKRSVLNVLKLIHLLYPTTGFSYELLLRFPQFFSWRPLPFGSLASVCDRYSSPPALVLTGAIIIMAPYGNKVAIVFFELIKIC